LRAFTLGDCQAGAHCAFVAYAAANCSGGGVPKGTSTCAEALSCEEGCNMNKQGAPCLCVCAASMDPKYELLLYNANSCAEVNCHAACNPPTAACNSCGMTACSAQGTACLQH
jgi:hypothetical protein